MVDSVKRQPNRHNRMKIDFKKSLPCYAARHNKFAVLDIPVLSYLMIDGRGDPNTSPEYQAAIRTLYPVAYGLKFLSKNELGKDYVVPPLEGLWWADDMETFTSRRDKSQWRWTMMIMSPDWIDAPMLDVVREKLAAKLDRKDLDRLRFQSLKEGRCVQVLHIGSYDDEAPLLERLHSEFIPQNGFRMTGKHHEIYLSDTRRVAPEKLRTILRQPVEPVD